jgi:hypothetical protein
MEQRKNKSSRKKFLLWGTAALSSIGLLNYFSATKPKNTKTIKMLTQDGKLVEVDADKINRSRREMVSDEQLKKWVNRKSS